MLRSTSRGYVKRTSRGYMKKSLKRKPLTARYNKLGVIGSTHESQTRHKNGYEMLLEKMWVGIMFAAYWFCRVQTWFPTWPGHCWGVYRMFTPHSDVAAHVWAAMLAGYLPKITGSLASGSPDGDGIIIGRLPHACPLPTLCRTSWRSSGSCVTPGSSVLGPT